MPSARQSERFKRAEDVAFHLFAPVERDALALP